ncbi:MAG: CopG family transcriptional regulator [Phycicoccus sp.]
MRTTLAIDDEVLSAAKRRARREGTSLGTVVEDALRRYLARAPEVADPPAIPVFRGGRGVRPGVDLSSNRSIQELLDDGVEVDRLR